MMNNILPKRPQKEYGSEPYALLSHFTNPPSHWLPDDASLFGTGSDALRAIIRDYIGTHPRATIWFPSYFCSTVVEAAARETTRLAFYDDRPFISSESCFDRIGCADGDVVLWTNYFGLRCCVPYETLHNKSVLLIEDHTHDPWSPCAEKSQADWCIASLRKTLPLYHGGMAWSPTGHGLSVKLDFTPERELAILRKTVSMLLRGLYLHNIPISKPIFRQLYLQGEDGLYEGDISLMPTWTQQLLDLFPVNSWRQQRLANHTNFVKAFSSNDDVSILAAEDARCVPFAIVLDFKDVRQRDISRSKLISDEIYPAVLWPQTGQNKKTDIEFSKHMLVLWCDMRYKYDDMEYLAEAVTKTLPRGL